VVVTMIIHQKRSPGYSLLEVVLASTLCASALVPALAILRDGMALSRKIDTRNLLHLYGTSKLEEHLVLVAASWATGTLIGDFATEGHPSLRYTVTRSDATADGGLVNRLMNVTVTTYNDTDNDDSLSADEPQMVLTTKISKLISYETLAGS